MVLRLLLVLFFRIGFFSAIVITEQFRCDQPADEQAGDEDSIQHQYFFA